MDYFIYYLYGISKYILQNVYAIFGLHLAFFLSVYTLHSKPSPYFTT